MPPVLNDNEIIKNILNGQTWNYEVLVSRYQKKLINFLLKMGSNPEDAEDVSQETFIKAYNNLYKYKYKWKFSTWLFTIALNTFKDLKKKNKGKIVEFTNEMEFEDKNNHIENIHNKDIADKMLNYLDDNTKAMVIMYYYNDFSIIDIGKILKKTPASVKMKIKRARHKMLDKYKESLRGDVSNEVLRRY